MLTWKAGLLSQLRSVDNVRDGQVVDVERLVVLLVALKLDRGELLEDRLVDGVKHETGQDAHKGEVGDRERQEQAQADDHRDDQNL